LEAGVVILLRQQSGTLASVSTTYKVDGTLTTIEEDFGNLAPAALRHLEVAAVMAEIDPDRRIRQLGEATRKQIEAQRKYEVLTDAIVPLQIERALFDIAAEYHRRTSERLTITSGSRTPAQQADAMYDKLAAGDNILALYREQSAARAIKAAFDKARSENASRATAAAEITRVIEQQVRSGIYISRHLLHGAVDIRTRDLPEGARRVLREIIESSSVVRLGIEETIPPHYHIELVDVPNQ